MDFRKAFDGVRCAALWSTIKQHNINTNLIKVLESLYSKATSSVYYNDSLGEWLRSTVGIMTDALEDHEGSVSIGGRTITNLSFTDDIVPLQGKKKNLST